MIVISEINILETDRDYYEWHNETRGPKRCTHMQNPMSMNEIMCTSSFIQGKIFINPKTNEKIVVGWSEDVEKVLGFPFEAFETMENETARVRDVLYDTELDLGRITETYNALSKIYSREINDRKFRYTLGAIYGAATTIAIAYALLTIVAIYV